MTIVFDHAKHLRTLANFRSAYKKGPMIVMVYESWCGASQRAAPEFDKAAAELQGLFVVDSQPPKTKAVLLRALNFEPQYWPTVLGVSGTKVIEMKDAINSQTLRTFQTNLKNGTEK